MKWLALQSFPARKAEGLHQTEVYNEAQKMHNSHRSTCLALLAWQNQRATVDSEHMRESSMVSRNFKGTCLR